MYPKHSVFNCSRSFRRKEGQFMTVVYISTSLPSFLSFAFVYH